MKERPVLEIGLLRRYEYFLRRRDCAFLGTPAPARGPGPGLAGLLIMVRLKKFNQGPIDPDHNFNRDHNCGENFSIKVWLKK
jgi:hypothetical protein